MTSTDFKLHKYTKRSPSFILVCRAKSEKGTSGTNDGRAKTEELLSKPESLNYALPSCASIRRLSAAIFPLAPFFR